jgi:hypothetical protein
MEKLLQDIEAVVDLSNYETEKLIETFKQFIDRNFQVDPLVLQQVFTYRPGVVLNQQEDEDNLHALWY